MVQLFDLFSMRIHYMLHNMYNVIPKIQIKISQAGILVDYQVESNHLKVYLQCDLQPHPIILSKKLSVTTVEAFRYLIFVWMVCLADIFVWRNNRRIVDLCQHNKYHAKWPICNSRTQKNMHYSQTKPQNLLEI